VFLTVLLEVVTIPQIGILSSTCSKNDSLCRCSNANGTVISNNGIVCNEAWMSGACGQYSTCSECLARWPNNFDSQVSVKYRENDIHPTGERRSVILHSAGLAEQSRDCIRQGDPQEGLSFCHSFRFSRESPIRLLSLGVFA